MRVKMIPHWLNIQGHQPSGIQTTIKKYFEHLPATGIVLVDPDDNNYDIVVVHAGMSQDFPRDVPIVVHNHGLYWTGDYDAAAWEYRTNAYVISNLRMADVVTVPSPWVGESLKRDMHINPIVLPHGIDYDEWQHNLKPNGYVLWNKNRMGDVCDPEPLVRLAERFPEHQFVTTFADGKIPPNVNVIGLQEPETMKLVIQQASIYLATTKETFGIGTLEAMASGVPILGYNHGGTADIVDHGTSGYLAQPGSLDDLSQGLEWCFENRDPVGLYAKVKSKQYTWEKVARQMFNIYAEAFLVERAPSVSVVIPIYNKSSEQIRRAVSSAKNQTKPPKEIVLVNDGSVEECTEFLRDFADKESVLLVENDGNQGVAIARNNGVRATHSKYVCCLDGDDEIEPEFLQACVDTLEAERSLGVAYTKLNFINDETGAESVSAWPDRYNYNDFIARKNQVPTCAVFRRDIFDRLGGYRQRYAPLGAGAEDAEFWLRMGAIGYGGKLASVKPLFRYHSGGLTNNDGYYEVDWLSWHPWAQDGLFPFACLVNPGTKRSHPVHQYDSPIVSVIIPCSPPHEKYLVDALDSLEAQTFRKWEAIVITDGFRVSKETLNAHPFANFVEGDGRGAGAARNLGATLAKGSRLLFLDADDYLMPEALQDMMDMQAVQNEAMYSDYYGLAEIHGELAPGIELVNTNPKTNLSLLKYRASKFNKEKAFKQPENPPYVWNNITTLIWKHWHEQIGGFDESLPSWEDVDYWWRMARAGIGFHRISRPLMIYRFHTGTRRQEGLERWDELLNLLGAKVDRQPVKAL